MLDLDLEASGIRVKERTLFDGGWMRTTIDYPVSRRAEVLHALANIIQGSVGPLAEAEAKWRAEREAEAADAP